MARQPVTRLQVSGYRFLIRRMEHALVRGDVRMLDDPLRAQSLSLVAGCILAVIAIAGCAILAFLKPQGELGSAPIVMARTSGALYVRIGDTVHPVPNLASARLVAGTAANPEMVGDAAINEAKRGPLVGIPGAPAVIANPLTEDESEWAVCDTATGPSESTTTVIAAADGANQPDRERSVLVTPRSQGAATTYLLYDGWRAKVDLRNAAVVRALRLDGIAPRPVSRALLDAIPEAPEITAPHIPAAGSPGPPSMAGSTVGTVVRITRADAAEYYVVLADGVQRIGEVAADLIRLVDSQRGQEIATVAPDAIGAVTIVNVLPVTTFPDHADTTTGAAGEPVLCARWEPTGPLGHTNTTVLVRNSLPLDSGDKAVTLAQADGAGPNVDAVCLPPGRSAYVRAVGITGDGGSGGPLYLMTDTGVLFGVHDEDAAEHLGLPSTPVPAPWPMLAVLPRGPELSTQGASVVRDSVAPPA